MELATASRSYLLLHRLPLQPPQPPRSVLPRRSAVVCPAVLPHLLFSATEGEAGEGEEVEKGKRKEGEGKGEGEGEGEGELGVV